MGIVSRNILKGWFVTRAKPTQTQYGNNFDSFFHLTEDTLPIAKVDGLQTALNNLYLNQNSGGTGGVSQTETYLAINGDFQKDFVVGKTLNSIVIDPPGSTTITINIGTTPAGTDIAQAMTVDAENPEPFERSKYFKNATTWYFTGIPINSTIIFFYK